MHFRLPVKRSVFAARYGSRAILVTSCSLIAACVGSGGGSGPQVTKLDVLTASAEEMIIGFQQVGFSDPGQVPTSGTADYSGYFLAQLANTDDNLTNSISGEMTIGVDFASTEMISGTVFGVFDDNSEAMFGQIALSGGTLDRDGDPNVDATLTFEGDGTLIDINSNSIDLDLVFEGDFLGPNANGIGGNILGQAITDDGNQSVGGVFVTEAVDNMETP